MEKKKIKFANDHNKLHLIFILLIGLSFVLIALIQPFYWNESMYNYLNIAGYFLLAIGNLSLFLNKNYAQFTNKSIHIRLDSLLGKNISFSEINSVVSENNSINIHLKNNHFICFKTGHITPNDIDKLMDIIKTKLDEQA
ncbi:MAG: hypothetical protein MRY51_01250 [Flavobacteriaceae bacterium]|nr:hypothetical protein [Flavobacteriaceae bacterium]MCI5087736.1 hypothetical protein [Flavobacteriaceae bacterium]